MTPDSLPDTQLMRNLAGRHFNGIAVLEQYIVQQLPATPTLAAAAQVLHMSNRSLQRHLQLSNCSFRHLVARCRHQLAQQYLQDDSLSLQQIAFQLGFEEQSSFQKAFKCWQGCSPGRFRQHKQQGRAQLYTRAPGVTTGEIWN